MGANDDREMLKVAKEGCGRLQRENAELRKTNARWNVWNTKFDLRAQAAEAERDGLLLLINSAITEANLWHVYDSRDTGPVFSEVVREELLEILTASTAQSLADHDAEVAATERARIIEHLSSSSIVTVAGKGGALEWLRKTETEGN